MTRWINFYPPCDTERQAVLDHCLVRTLDERDPGFGKTFLENLDDAYAEVRDGIGETDLLEVLTWAGSIVTSGNYNGGGPK